MPSGRSAGSFSVNGTRCRRPLYGLQETVALTVSPGSVDVGFQLDRLDVGGAPAGLDLGRRIRRS